MMKINQVLYFIIYLRPGAAIGCSLKTQAVVVRLGAWPCRTLMQAKAAQHKMHCPYLCDCYFFVLK